MKKCFSVVLLTFFVFLGLVSFAEESLNVTLHVNRSEVEIGDSLRVDWKITGGTPPYHTSFEWCCIWPVDHYYAKGEDSGFAEFEVEGGMMQKLDFRIDVWDEGKHKENYLSKSLKDFNLEVTNLDGWPFEENTIIRVAKPTVRLGETIEAVVYKAFETSQGTQDLFSHQWVETDENGKSIYGKREHTKGSYKTVLTYTPKKTGTVSLLIENMEIDIVEHFKYVPMKPIVFKVTPPLRRIELTQLDFKKQQR